MKEHTFKFEGRPYVLVYEEKLFELTEDFYNLKIEPGKQRWEFAVRFFKEDSLSPGSKDYSQIGYQDIKIIVGDVRFGASYVNPNRIEVINEVKTNFSTNYRNAAFSELYQELSNVEIRFQWDEKENTLFYRVCSGEAVNLEGLMEFEDAEFDSFIIYASSGSNLLDIKYSIKSDSYGIEHRSDKTTSVMAVGKVTYRLGDMFDHDVMDDTDAIIMPASSTGSANSNIRNRASELKIPYPSESPVGTVVLYESVYGIKAGYGYSVMKSQSSAETIRLLCGNIINVASGKDIEVINIPIFGTGAGDLHPEDVIEIYDKVFNAYDNSFRIIVSVQSASVFKLIRSKFSNQLIYLKEWNAKQKPDLIRELEKELNIEIDISFFDVNSKGEVIRLNLSLYEIQDITFVKKFKNLQYLTIKSVGINDYSPLAALTRLENLYLNGCQVKDLSFLNKLKQLIVLDLGNSFAVKFEDIAVLKKLKGLYLRGNFIEEIGFLADLKELEVLDLSFNQIRDITPLANLVRIQNLNISDNKIVDISALDDCENLEILDISYNAITNFSVLTRLPRIQHLKADKNPFINNSDIILDGFDNHWAPIYNFMLRQLETDKKPVTLPAKVLLLGNHESGKSSLLHYLQEENLNANSTSTHIINIEKYPKNAPGIPDAIFYDFGGQDYYHGIYRAFLSAGSIYLILWNMAKDENTQIKDRKGLLTQDFSLSYWLAQKKYLENEKYAGAIDPTLIVQTYADMHPKDSCARKIIDKSIKNEFYVSLLNNEVPGEMGGDVNFHALKYLKASIVELIANKRQNRLEPQWYIDFLSFILKMNSRGDYKSKSLEKDILPHYRRNVENKLEMLKEDLDQLHKQGLILYYKSDMPDRVWLNPVALVKFIHTEVLSEAFKKDCSFGLEEKVLIENKDVIDLLCYQKVIFKHLYGEAGEEYIIPNYLPLTSEFQTDFALLTFGLNNPLFTLRFRDFLPFGFVNQLVCFFGKLPDKKKFWRDQILFTIGNKARILISIDFKYLEIRVLASFVSGETDHDSYIKYLFYCIVGLYWDLDLFEFEDYIAMLHGKINRENFSAEDPMYRKVQCFDNIYEKNECRPSDLYISVNEKDFISYVDLCSAENTVMINSVAINKNYALTGPQKSISIYPFRNFTLRKLNRRKKVVISYSKDDLRLVNQFLKYLVPLYDAELIESPWYCTMLVAGTEWDDEISRKFAEADIVFFMISDNLMATKYVQEVEVKNAIDRWDRDKSVRIVPILLVSYPFARIGKYNLARFNALPYTLKAVSRFKDRHTIWYSITNAIRIMIEKDLDPEGDKDILTKEYLKIYEDIINVE